MVIRQPAPGHARRSGAGFVHGPARDIIFLADQHSLVRTPCRLTTILEYQV